MKYLDEPKKLIFDNQILLFTLIYQIPEPRKKYLSPFRIDKTPGCYFWLADNNKLFFVDYGDIKIRRDIISFTKDLYKFNYNQAINYLISLIKDKNNLILKNKITKYKFLKKTNNKTDIEIKSRYFTKKDVEYWKQYSISLYDLIDNHKNYKIIPIEHYKINNKIKIIPDNISYAYIFDNKKKIYTPYSENRKWISSVTKDLIGKTNKRFDNLVITKSVKDAILLNKLNYDYLIFQSESSFPNKKIIKKNIQKYKNIYINFDNDQTGRRYSMILYYILKYEFGINAKQIFTKKEKDNSDFTKKYGLNSLNNIYKSIIY